MYTRIRKQGFPGDLKFSSQDSGVLFFILLKFVLSYALVNGIYEIHRDEFLHLDQANHLAAGFTSVPPLTSLFSWLIKLFGNDIFWVRFFPALSGCLTILFCWLIVSELKGNFFSKCLVASACICSALLRLNTLYQPNSFDVLAWTAIFYFFLRYFATKTPKYLYFFAIWTALGFLNKYNILFLLLGLIPAIIVTSKSEIFKNWHLFFAIIAFLLLIMPNVIWQIVNDFPVIHHMKELTETQLSHLKHTDFFKEQVLCFVSDIFILLGSFIGFAIYSPFKKHRWIVLTFIFTLIILSFFNAKGYYALGLYPVLLAFGSVYLTHLFAKRYIFHLLLLLFVYGSFIYILPLVMPLYTPKEIVASHQRFAGVGLLKWGDGKDHDLPQDYADMLGWKELAILADSAYKQMPDKAHLLILCDNYGEAGAINYYSSFKNMQAVAYSGDYINWFHFDHRINHIIRIRSYENLKSAALDQVDFADMTKIGSVKNKYCLEYGTTVFLLRNAKIDVNAKIKGIIKEKKNDYTASSGNSR